MALKIFALFIFMFLLYIPFTRNPDYFDSKFTTATVKETGTNKFIAKFTINGKDTVQFNPAYPLRKLKDNQQIKTIEFVVAFLSNCINSIILFTLNFGISRKLYFFIMSSAKNL